MVFPDIQTRAERFLRQEGSFAAAAPGVLIGALLATSFVIQLLVSPRWGALSDRVGRRPVFVGCQVLSALALLVYGSADTYLLLLVSRVLSGLGSANVAVAQAYLADLTSAEGRAAGMGRVSAAVSAGLIGGPALGGFLAHSGGNRLVGFVGAGLSAFGAVLAFFAMRRIPPLPREGEIKRPWRAIDLSLLGRYPSIRPLILVSVVASFALATLEGTFGRLIARTLGYGEREFGIVFSYESLLTVGVGAFGLAWISKWVNRTALLRGAFLVQGLGLALFPAAGKLATFAPGMLALLFASTLYALGAGAVNPTVSAATSAAVPSERQGELFGLLQIARNFGFVVGPILGGRLFDLAPAAPYLFAGAVSVAAAVVVPRVSTDVASA